MFSNVLLFLTAGGFLAAANPGAPVLQHERYTFCHDADYPLSSRDARWCPLIGERSDVCPTLPAACAKPPRPVDLDVTLGGSGSGSGDGVAGGDIDDGDGDAEGRAARGEGRFRPGTGNGTGSGSGNGSGTGNGTGNGSSTGNGNGSGTGNGSGSGTGAPTGDPSPATPPSGPRGSPTASPSASTPPAPKPPEKKAEPPPPPLPPPSAGMSAFAQILLIFLIGGGALLLARAIAKHLSWRKKQGDLPEEAEPEKTVAQTVRAAEPRGPVETDVERLLRRAQAAAQRGDFTKAVEDAYAALLRRLDGAGLIEIHPSRTNGDYVRALDEKPELKSSVRAIVRDVERAQFGSEAPSAQLFQAVFDRVVPIATRAIGVCALLLACSSVVSCGKDGGSSGSPKGDTRPYGTAALMQLLTERGRDVSHRKEPLGNIDDESTDKVLVLLRGAEIDPQTWSRVIDWTSRGGTLVVAGLRHLPRELAAEPADDPADATKLERRGRFEFGFKFSELDVVAPTGTRLRTSSSPSSWVLARGDEPYAVQTIYGTGRAFVFAERALFTNIAFTVGDNAQFVTTFLDDLDREDIEIVDLWTGAGAGSPLESIRKARLTAVVLQLLALAILFLVWKGAHFGKPRDPASKSRRAFADHVRALGHIYARAKASEHALGNFSAWAIERLRERFYRGQRSGLSPLAEAIAKRTGKDETQVMRVLVEAQSARESAGPPSSFRPGFRGDLTAPPKRGTGEERDLGIIRALFDFLRTNKDRTKGTRAKTP